MCKKTHDVEIFKEPLVCQNDVPSKYLTVKVWQRKPDRGHSQLVGRLEYRRNYINLSYFTKCYKKRQILT